MKHFVALLLLIGSYAAQGQTLADLNEDPIPTKVILSDLPAMEKWEPLATDRPSASAGPSIVPLGQFQFETGGMLSANNNDVFENTTITYNNMVIRIGVLSNMEFRITSNVTDFRQKFVPQDSITGSDFGIDPITLGVKIRPFARKGVFKNSAFMIQAGLNRVASPTRITTYVPHSITYITSYGIGDNGSFTSNLGLAWGGIGPDVSGIYTLNYGYAFSKQIAVFAELYGNWPQAAGLDVSADAGMTWLLNENLQLDVSGGIGISERTEDWFVAGGISWRLGG